MLTRFLIVNADDFGQSPGINEGIIQAHEQGVVSSATLMVRWPAAANAAEYARASRSLGVGLHFDVAEWVLENGEWRSLYEVVDASDATAVERELQQQLDRFEQLVGRIPTHIDSHQHAHLKEPVRSVVLAASRRLGIPVRSFDVPYCGRFYGQDENAQSQPEWVSAETFVAILEDLTESVTEMCCHPAAREDLNSMYRQERLWELETLCDPALKAALAQRGVRLTSFANFPRWGDVPRGV